MGKDNDSISPGLQSWLGKTKTEEIMFKNIREENSCSFKKFNRPQVAETQSDLYLDTLYIVKLLQAREKENLKSSKRKRAYYTGEHSYD